MHTAIRARAVARRCAMLPLTNGLPPLLAPADERLEAWVVAEEVEVGVSASPTKGHLLEFERHF